MKKIQIIVRFPNLRYLIFEFKVSELLLKKDKEGVFREIQKMMR